MIFRTAQGQNRLQEAASVSGLLVQEDRKRISFRRLRTQRRQAAAELVAEQRTRERAEARAKRERERAERRAKERPEDIPAIEAALTRRDEADRRQITPAADALVIDTGPLDLQGVIDVILSTLPDRRS